MRIAAPARFAIAAAALSATLAGCATGFGSPTRHAIANVQAARIAVSPTLHVENAIIALPAGTLAGVGGYAYLQFTGINFSTQPETLINAGVAAPVVPTAAGAAPASPSAASTQIQPVGSTQIPAATASTPGSAHITILLRGLVAPLEQGESVFVNLTFHNNGSVVGLQVPVQSAKAVGKDFLPSAPPPSPSSATPTPTPTPTLPPSAPASSASSAPGSTPASASTSASPAASS